MSENEDSKIENVFQMTNCTIETLRTSFMENLNQFPHLHFAWEKGRYHADLMNHIRTMIHPTTRLVVIGYSFPFFNLEIDKQIFESFTKDFALKKIYYHDPKLDGRQLKLQFKLNADVEIIHVKNTSNFHIPFEY